MYISFLFSCRENADGVSSLQEDEGNVQASFLLGPRSTAYSRERLGLAVGAFGARLRTRDSLPRGVSPGVAPVAGVEFASAFESASAEDGRAAGASVEEAGEDCSVALSRLGVGSGVLVSEESGVSSMNRRKALGASLRVTSSVVGAFFAAPARLERPLEVEPAGMVGVERTLEQRKRRGFVMRSSGVVGRRD